MRKSLHNKQLSPLAVLTVVLCSMTLTAMPLAAQPGDNGEPNAEKLITEELVDLVAPVALYPDDLLAIVLPAAAYPLQIVQAARFLEKLENDDSLQPDEDWDESVVALLNYPEVINLLNDDLDWTWQLGEAVLNQETEVIAAVEIFRDRAALAGNLKSDEHQVVNIEDGAIEITPVAREVIYVPYYEPERVVVYQAEPVYHYYPRPYPVYYYPYPVDHYFYSGFFWGITTAFAIGWNSHHLQVHYSDYYSHPYYGHSYYPSQHYYHRRPHYDSRHQQARGGSHDGDHWQPGRHHGARPSDRHPMDDQRRDNQAIAVSGVPRFEGRDTFKPRPGFKGKKVGVSRTTTSPAGRSGVDRSLALTRDTGTRSRGERARQYHAIPKMDHVSQQRQSPGKTKRNRLDVEPDRRDSSNTVVQYRSSAVRVDRPARSHDRDNKRTAPSNQDRRVNRSDRNRVVRSSRAEPAAGIRLPARAVNTFASSNSRAARPAPVPRQSHQQRPVTRSMASRQAPVARKSPSPARSDRGGGKFNGSRGQNRREGRVGRK